MNNLIPATHDLKIWRRGVFSRTFRFRDSAGAPIDLSGGGCSAVASAMRPGGSTRYDLVAAISNGADGAVTITPVPESIPVGAGLSWELVVTRASVRQQPWVVGTLEILESVNA